MAIFDSARNTRFLELNIENRVFRGDPQFSRSVGGWIDAEINRAFALGVDKSLVQLPINSPIQIATHNRRRINAGPPILPRDGLGVEVLPFETKTAVQIKSPIDFINIYDNSIDRVMITFRKTGFIDPNGLRLLHLYSLCRAGLMLVMARSDNPNEDEYGTVSTPPSQLFAIIESMNGMIQRYDETGDFSEFAQTLNQWNHNLTLRPTDFAEVVIDRTLNIANYRSSGIPSALRVR